MKIRDVSLDQTERKVADASNELIEPERRDVGMAVSDGGAVVALSPDPKFVDEICNAILEIEEAIESLQAKRDILQKSMLNVVPSQFLEPTAERTVLISGSSMSAEFANRTTTSWDSDKLADILAANPGNALPAHIKQKLTVPAASYRTLPESEKMLLEPARETKISDLKLKGINGNV